MSGFFASVVSNSHKTNIFLSSVWININKSTASGFYLLSMKQFHTVNHFNDCYWLGLLFGRFFFFFKVNQKLFSADFLYTFPCKLNKCLFFICFRAIVVCTLPVQKCSPSPIMHQKPAATSVLNKAERGGRFTVTSSPHSLTCALLELCSQSEETQKIRFFLLRQSCSCTQHVFFVD